MPRGRVATKALAFKPAILSIDLWLRSANFGTPWKTAWYWLMACSCVRVMPNKRIGGLLVVGYWTTLPWKAKPDVAEARRSNVDARVTAFILESDRWRIRRCRS